MNPKALLICSFFAGITAAALCSILSPLEVRRAFFFTTLVILSPVNSGNLRRRSSDGKSRAGEVINTSPSSHIHTAAKSIFLSKNSISNKYLSTLNFEKRLLTINVNIKQATIHTITWKIREENV